MGRNKKFLFIILFATIFMAIGYATVNNVTLSTSGAATAANNGDVKIKSVVLTDYNKLTNPQNAVVSYTDDSINFDLEFTVTNDDLVNNESFYATFKVVLENDTISDYAFGSTGFTPSVETQSDSRMTAVPEITGAYVGETIPAKTSKEFYITIHMYPTEQGAYSIIGDSEVNTEVDTGGIIAGSIVGNATGNLQGNNTIAGFTISVMNTYKTSKTFTLSTNNSNFIITNSNGGALGNFVVNAEDTEQFNFYIMKNSNATFLSDTHKVSINLVPVDEDPSNAGVVTLLVDANSAAIDTTPPQVSNVTGTLQSTIGTVLVDWEGSDDIAIDYYKIDTYSSNGTFIKTQNTNADETEAYVSNLGDGNYYFVITAYDQGGNTATAQSTAKEFRWTFTVTYHLTNANTTGSNSDTVTYGNDYSVTLSGATGYNSPATVTILMGGNSTNSYSYTTSSGSLNIRNVTGDLDITAKGTANGDNPCFAEGTEILLADGTTKKVEDIGYDDLLAVWNYDTGTLTYEYPLWIENESVSPDKTRVTFEDNSYIDFVRKHSIYNVDLKQFVSIEDPVNFHVGSHTYKLDENNNLVPIAVKSIEKIVGNTKYYMVGSTTYYNVFASRILTTDRNLMISNLYGFEDNAKWPEFKNYIVNNPDNWVSYEDIKDVLPYYLYDGFRVRELGFLINTGQVTLEEFKYYITSLITNVNMVKSPIKIDGDRYWMVTTSLDDVTDENKENFLVKEGSTIKLPQTDKRWYSTAENVYYNSEDYVEVWHGMHFIEK